MSCPISLQRTRIMLIRPGARNGREGKGNSRRCPKTRAYSNKSCTKPCCDPQLWSRDFDIERPDSPRGLLERCDGENPSTRNGHLPASLCYPSPRAGPARNLPTGRQTLHHTAEETPPTVGRGGIKLGSLAGAWLLSCLAMPPCRDFCNVGIGIDYGDCVVACWALSRDFTTVPQYSTTLFRNKLRGGPFGLLLLACLTAGCVWLPSCPSTHINRRPCPARQPRSKLVAKGEATSDSHRAARCLD